MFEQNNSVNAVTEDKDYIIHCSPISLYFFGTTYKITAVPYIVKIPMLSDNILATPALRLYKENLMNEYGIICPVEDKLICELDYRNAMQIAQFLSFELAKNVSSPSTQKFTGGITITIEPVDEDNEEMDKYAITIFRENADKTAVSSYVSGFESDIMALIDVIEEFAINRHVYYYEWLIHKHIIKENEKMKNV